MSTPEEKLVNNIFGGDTGESAPGDDNTPGPKDPEMDTLEDAGEGNDRKPDDKPAEKLLAGKYKTVEELEAAYKEAEKNFHLDRQDRAELRRRLDELKAALAPKKPEADPKERRQKLIERMYEEPDTVIAELADEIADKKMQERLGPIMPVIQQQAINSQVQQFMARVKDAHEYENDMAAIIQAEPGIMRDPNWLGRAYLLAKTARLEARLADKTGDDPAKAADAKKAAAMPRGGKGDPNIPASEEEKLKKSIFGDPGGGKRKMFDF